MRAERPLAIPCGSHNRLLVIRFGTGGVIDPHYEVEFKRQGDPL
jgi:hypothetical protein